MFRKFWKTLKYIIIAIIILICLPHSILPRQSAPGEPGNISEYAELNNRESRLAEYKDDDEALKLKLTQLEVINRSRRKFRAEPVRLDILASRVANKMCREAAENKFTGHWNLEGEKPYQRYAFAGGHDHVSENAFGEWTSGAYDKSPATIQKMMKGGHDSFMSEKAPADGHKKNIIEKFHNYVGIGYYITNTQFRYYEEFIDRYFEFGDVPADLKVNEEGILNFSTDGRNYPYFLIAYREDFPRPMSLKQIERQGSYADFSKEEYLSMPAWEIAGFRIGNKYKIPLKFSKPGLYYIQIFAWKDEITKPGKLDTKGKTPASGIVIRVGS